MRKSFGMYAALALAALGTSALDTPSPALSSRNKVKGPPVRRYRPRDDDPLAAERKAHNDAVDAKRAARKAGRK